MNWKKWIKRYGFHFVLCTVAIGSAFYANQKLKFERSHTYTISEDAYTLLEELTELKIEEDKLILSGWGFDTEYYNESSRCELIFQETKNQDALWAKMEKNPEPVKMKERYSGGMDYSKGSFRGSIKADRLNNETIYEVLLRYSTTYMDELGKEWEYVKTVSTGNFLYQNRLTEYNPKTFQEPEIAETELEAELQGARVFHYFNEGMWIYYNAESLYYIVDKELLKTGKGTSFPVLWFVRNTEDLPENNRPYGFGNNAFYLTQNEYNDPGIKKYRVWKTAMPSNQVIKIETGLYNDAEKIWILKAREQIGDVFYE